jgi:hypothetical protein
VFYSHCARVEEDEDDDEPEPPLLLAHPPDADPGATLLRPELAPGTWDRFVELVSAVTYGRYNKMSKFELSTLTPICGEHITPVQAFRVTFQGYSKLTFSFILLTFFNLVPCCSTLSRVS